MEDTKLPKPEEKVNVIVTCPKAFRCFKPETKEMFDEVELIRLGIVMTAHGKLYDLVHGRPVTDMCALWNTRHKDATGLAIYEGDICEIGIDTGLGSVETGHPMLVKRVGKMRWEVASNAFNIHFNGRSMFSGQVRIVSCTVIGNEYQDKAAAEAYAKDNE